MRNTCYLLTDFLLRTLLRPHDITQLPLPYPRREDNYVTPIGLVLIYSYLKLTLRVFITKPLTLSLSVVLQILVWSSSTHKSIRLSMQSLVPV